MPDPMRPDDQPLRLWLVVRRPDDLVLWVEADRLRSAGQHLELVIDVVFLGRPRAVVERRLVEQAVLVCEPVDHLVPWGPLDRLVTLPAGAGQVVLDRGRHVHSGHRPDRRRQPQDGGAGPSGGT